MIQNIIYVSLQVSLINGIIKYSNLILSNFEFFVIT